MFKFEVNQCNSYLSQTTVAVILKLTTVAAELMEITVNVRWSLITVSVRWTLVTMALTFWRRDVSAHIRCFQDQGAGIVVK